MSYIFDKVFYRCEMRIELTRESIHCTTQFKHTIRFLQVVLCYVKFEEPPGGLLVLYLHRGVFTVIQ